MAITGTHVLIYTSEPDAVREMFRDVFGFEHVDDGDGWLIFALPPAELGVHPTAFEVKRDLSFICDDLESTMEELRAKGVEFEGEPVDEGWGIGAMMKLPGGAGILLYEPRHASPLA
jgi:catechol 2,3-dioxygenase-like lactoylglutathione lyase family enzyme